MKQILTFLPVLLTLLSSLSLTAQNNRVQRYIETLKKDTLFQNSVTGIMVMDSRGRTVAQWNPDMPLLTASTMKTISTGIALKVLGPDYQFATKLAYSGYIQNGVLYGDLFIVGGADPTLGSQDTLAIPTDSLFMGWKMALDDAGIKRINGNVVADDRFLVDEIVPTSWSWSNIGPSYGHSASGLSFSENRQYFTFVPGLNAGDNVHLKRVYPTIPGMEYQNLLTTGSNHTGNRTAYYTTDLTRIGKFRGSMAAGADSVLVVTSSKFPHLSCAYEFREYLVNKGVLSNPAILDAKEFDAPSLGELTVITETLSPPLTSIINVTNRISNNFYAEVLLKMIGKQMTGVGSYDSSRVAVIREFRDMGLNTTGFSQADGSGLSRMNLVSARFFCNYYAKMRETDIFDYFFESLPQPGGPGTLRTVLADEKEADKQKIHAKSGSLGNVRCYAGYVERKPGEFLYFAILVNNYSARTAQMQVGIEGFMRELTKY